MTSFKIGDRVRDISGHAESIYSLKHATGTIIANKYNAWEIKWDDDRIGPTGWYDNQIEHIETPTPSLPTRTVTTTRIEIVPGDYDRLTIGRERDGLVHVIIKASSGGHKLNADEVRSAIATLSALLPALEQDKA